MNKLVDDCFFFLISGVFNANSVGDYTEIEQFHWDGFTSRWVINTFSRTFISVDFSAIFILFKSFILVFRYVYFMCCMQ